MASEATSRASSASSIAFQLASIFSWQYLYSLGTGKEAIWAEYLEALDKAGLSRDP